jgi:hypothetical protein
MKLGGKNLKIPRCKWKYKIPEPMGNSESSSKREVYTYKCL